MNEISRGADNRQVVGARPRVPVHRNSKNGRARAHDRGRIPGFGRADRQATKTETDSAGKALESGDRNFVGASAALRYLQRGRRGSERKVARRGYT